MTQNRSTGSSADTVIGAAFLVLLCFVASSVGLMAAFFELSNTTCGQRGCYTPWVNRGVMVAWAGAEVAMIGSLIFWFALGIARGWRVGYVPVVGGVVVVITYLVDAEIAT
ncbi:hypothetical protein [Nocardia exalbida]|uniref:hypothetical protein n=1 Tax=Nocardia exalbida TaxID=290231 RepID=UPI0002E8C877|nr:hypothetical protein [Nocardia exalbida]